MDPGTKQEGQTDGRTFALTWPHTHGHPHTPGLDLGVRQPEGPSHGTQKQRLALILLLRGTLPPWTQSASRAGLALELGDPLPGDPRDDTDTQSAAGRHPGGAQTHSGRGRHTLDCSPCLSLVCLGWKGLAPKSR